MLERARATFRLKPRERCPGEIICTNDPIDGVISRMNGETLETYCKPTRCKLYWTKEGTIPTEFTGMFEAAMMLREARLGKLRDEFKYLERTFPGWAVSAYKAAERSFRTAEAEINAETPEERQEREEGGGRRFADGGDSDAFARIEARIKQAREAAEQRDDWEKMLDKSPHIPGEIFRYMRAQS
jgi:hypothetical protein